MSDRPDLLAEPLRRLGADALAAAGIQEELADRYRETHRHYHGLGHLAFCLGSFTENRDLAKRPDEAQAALWFHDAVHDPRAGDSEERSARLALDRLKAAGVPEDVAGRIADLVRATDHTRLPGDPDAALVVDVDLHSLAAEPAAFDENTERLRREYAFLPEEEWRRRQADFFRRLLERGSVFATERYRERYEAAARENLDRALRGFEPGA